MLVPIQDPLEPLFQRGFNIEYYSHARSILLGEFAGPLHELANVLGNLSLPITEIIGSGGGETKFTQRTRRSLAALSWFKHIFTVGKTIDGVPRESISHEVDHVRTVPGVGIIGCEIEWNNKDPFFDRDLENFKRLHADGAISVGVIITRGASLQSDMYGMVLRFAQERGINDFEHLENAGISPTPKQKSAIARRLRVPGCTMSFAEVWASNFVSNKFGAATTHWSKLQDRVHRGVGNPCPLLLIGLPSSIVYFDAATVDQLEDDEGQEEAPPPGSGPLFGRI